MLPACLPGWRHHDVQTAGKHRGV